MRRMFGPPNGISAPWRGRALPRLRLRDVPDVAPHLAIHVAAGPVVLVLPARDEAASVGAVVRRTPTAIDGHPVRVLVVDDGSADDTAAQALAAGAAVLRLHPGRGLGAAVRAGLAHAVDVHGAAAVAFCDADGEYAPEDLADLVRPILRGEAHYVVGSRFTGSIESMQRRRRAGNRVLTAMLRVVARVPLTDGQSGYRALSRAAASECEILHDYNYAQVLTLDLLAKGFGYHEVPIRYRFRTTGRSFISLPTYLRRVAPAVLRELQTGAVAPGASRPPAPEPTDPRPLETAR